MYHLHQGSWAEDSSQEWGSMSGYKSKWWLWYDADDSNASVDEDSDPITVSTDADCLWASLNTYHLIHTMEILLHKLCQEIHKTSV